jgi:hypothetical protein
MPRPRRAAALAPLFALTLAGALACKSDPPPPSGVQNPAEAAPTAPPPAVDPPLPALRLGARAPAAGRPLSGPVLARHDAAGFNLVELRLPLQSDETGIDWDRLHIELEGEGEHPGEVAAITTPPGADAVGLLLRRPTAVASASKSLRGALYGVRWTEGRREWVRHPFEALAEGAAPAVDPDLTRRWAFALAEALEQDLWLDRGQSAPKHPWDRFAAGRLQTAFAPKAQPVSKDSRPFELQTRPPRTELSRLMETTSGVLSVQEALQHDRGLRLRHAAQPRSTPIAELRGPALDDHPFPAMQAQLPQPGAGAPEPLAAAAPADFWYARVDGIPRFYRLLDEADAWITPVAHILQQNPEDRRLAETYQAQLGLVRSELARILGPAVVGQIALVGSDPYIRQGSDLTVLFQVREPAFFDTELDRQVAQRAEPLDARGDKVSQQTREYAGTIIKITSDAHGHLRQHRARVGDVAVVSNSPRAIERVLDALTGAAPRLADEPDLKYMLARDPGQHHVFAFLSDRFIAAAVGPAQKIQAARRELALAELLTPGYAALLYGWLHGRSPADLNALHGAGLLDKAELRHESGEAIRFELPKVGPGLSPPLRVTWSSWGSPDFLTPILDLPPVTAVTDEERAAYQRFVDTYQAYWKAFIDPVALRLDLIEEGDRERALIDLRVLPLISATDYRELSEIVGDARIHVSAQDRGLVAVWGVGADSRTRRDFDGLLRSSAGKSEVSIGWLGDWVMLGVDDRSALLELYSWFDDAVQLASPRLVDRELEDVELWKRIGKFPIYAGAAVKNPAALVATLSGIRALVNEVAPGMVEWGELRRYRDLPIVRVGITDTAPLLRDRAVAQAVGLHYVQTGSSILLALDPAVLERQIDRALADQLPRADKDGAASFVIDASADRDMSLWTAALWALQGQANAVQPSADRAAEIVLRGAPEVRGPGALGRLSLAYLGAAPTSSRGASELRLTPTGAADPAIGTRIEPIFRELPHAGSPIERLMNHLRGLRAEVSFDREPAAAGPDARSLHTRVELRLTRP